MKMLILTLLTILVQPSLGSEAIKGAKKDLDSFKQEMSVELQAIEKNLKALSEKAEKKGDSTYKAALKDLTERRDKIRSDLSDLEADTKGNWKSMKSKFASSVRSLNEKIQNALKD